MDMPYQTIISSQVPTKMVRDRQEITKRGDNLHVREGCNNRILRGRNSKRFLLEHVSSPEKRMEGEARNQSEKIKSICPPPFKMESIQTATATELVQPNDWMTKIDLKDAYFKIPVYRPYQHYVRFMVDHHIYQFTCLTIGLTKTLRPVSAKLREFGMQLVIYLTIYW